MKMPNLAPWVAIVVATFLMIGTLSKSYVDWRTACLNADVQRKAQEVLERKDAYIEVHRYVEDNQKLQARYDEAVKEHHDRYEKLTQQYMVLYVKFLTKGADEATIATMVKISPAIKAVLEHGDEAIGAFEGLDVLEGLDAFNDKEAGK